MNGVRREAARAQLAFYGSTPTYAFILEAAGFGDVHARIRERQKAGDLAGMVAQVDESLEGYVESRLRSGVFVSASLASVPRHSRRPRVCSGCRAC